MEQSLEMIVGLVESGDMTNHSDIPVSDPSASAVTAADRSARRDSDATAALRAAAVKHTIESIKAVIDEAGAERDQLVEIERALLELADHADLFGRAAFPAPSETDDRNFLVSQEDDGTLALYVSTSKPGVVYRPHDHGATWAAVAAVSGAQHHAFYSTASGSLERIGGAVCEPGTPVSVPTGGIHSIHGGPEPLVHLHLYGVGFEHQHLRREFDPDTFAERRFRLDDLSFIEDRRPSVTVS